MSQVIISGFTGFYMIVFVLVVVSLKINIVTCLSFFSPIPDG